MTDGGVGLLASSGLLTALSSIVAQAHERRFDKGEPLFHEADPTDAFLVITEGSVKVYVTSERESAQAEEEEE